MEQLLPLLIWVVVTLIPLVPVYVGFKILNSSATFHNMARGTKLGGAIAAYFVLWTTGALMYNQLVRPADDTTAEIREQLTGAWDCDATIQGRKNEDGTPQIFAGTMYIDSVGQNLSMNGQTVNNTWNADVVIMDEKKMVFVFTVPVRSATGVSILRFVRNGDDTIHRMSGFWGLTGADGKGSLNCKPAAD